MLVVSFLTALTLYAGVYALAPSILLLQKNSSAARLPEGVQVDLLETIDTPRFEAVVKDAATMATRPGSVRDLLDRETEDLPLADTQIEETIPEESLAERIALNDVDREHALTPDQDVISGIEAQVLQISENAARGDVEIARRFARPTPDRIIARDEMIGAGGAGAARSGDALALNTLPPSVEAPGGSPTDAPRPSLAAEPRPLTPLEGNILEMDSELLTLPALPEESLLAGELARREVQEGSEFEQLDDLVHLQSETYVDPATRKGYFRLRIAPSQVGGLEVLPKDVTFVVDASNSILQRKLDLTIRGLRNCLAQLREGDRFNIVVFRDTHQAFREDLTHATSSEVEAALDFLKSVQSGGSTDVYSAVQPVIADPPRPGFPGNVIVLSDGRPTSGNLAGRDLINALTRQNIHGKTIFTFGGGRTVNRYLMDLLAYRNRGMTVVASKVEDIDEDLPRFFNQISDAILVDLHADYGRIDEESIYPRALPDFYHDRAIVVYGQYVPGEDEQLVLRLEGLAGETRKDMVLKASLGTSTQGDRGIAQGWAFQKSYHLIGEITRVGETPELMEELRRLSSEFNVRTSYFP